MHKYSSAESAVVHSCTVFPALMHCFSPFNPSPFPFSNTPAFLLKHVTIAPNLNVGHFPFRLKRDIPLLQVFPECVPGRTPVPSHILLVHPEGKDMDPEKWLTVVKSL